MYSFKGIASAFSVSLSNQIVSSATNFGLLIYLMRTLEKEEFGLYGVGFAVVMFLAGCIVSFVSVPLAVTYPSMHKDVRRLYAMHCFVISGLLGLVFITAAFCLHIYAGRVLPYSELYVPVALAVMFYSLRDVFSRVAYAERKEKFVLVGTVVIAMVTITALVFIDFFDLNVTSGLALIVYAISQFLGAIVLYGFLGGAPVSYIRLSGLLDAFRKSCGFGRWNVMTNIVFNIRTQCYNFISGPALGVAALGEVNAARAFVTPASMLTPPLSQILQPRLVEVREYKPQLLLKTSVAVVAFLSLVAMLYAIVLVPMLPWLVAFVTDDKYGSISGLIILWCVITVVIALRSGMSMVLEVLCLFDKIFVCGLISAFIAILLSLWLSQIMGAAGALLALLVSEFILCALLLVVICWSRFNV